MSRNEVYNKKDTIINRNKRNSVHKGTFFNQKTYIILLFYNDFQLGPTLPEG